MCQIMEDIRKKGREEGRQESLLRSIRNLMDGLSISAQEAMKALGVPENEWEKYAKLLQQ